MQIKRVTYLLAFKLSWFFYWVKDLPNEVMWRFTVCRYGGKDNVPKEISNRHLQHHLSNAILTDADAERLFLMGNMGILLKTYSLEVSDSKVALGFARMLHGDIGDNETQLVVARILKDQYPIRQFEKELAMEGTISQSQVDYRRATLSADYKMAIEWQPRATLTV